jgi:hypothetical protein
MGNLDAVTLGGLQDRFAFMGVDFFPVESENDRVRR